MTFIFEKILDNCQIKVYNLKKQMLSEGKIMAGKEDLRVRRTKKVLFDAFTKLMSEKTFDEITVNELCEEAGVRRATFYKHYADKFDFLTAYTHILRDNFDRSVAKAGSIELTTEYYVAYAKRIIHFVSENSASIDNICKSNLFPSVLAAIFEQNFKDTGERLRISVASGMTLPASVDTVAAMCAGGVAACIYGWLKEGRKTDPEIVAEQVGAVVAKLLV